MPENLKSIIERGLMESGPMESGLAPRIKRRHLLAAVGIAGAAAMLPARVGRRGRNTKMFPRCITSPMACAAAPSPTPIFSFSRSIPNTLAANFTSGPSPEADYPMPTSAAAARAETAKNRLRPLRARWSEGRRFLSRCR